MKTFCLSLLSVLFIVNSCSHSTIKDSEINFALSDTSVIDSIVIINDEILVVSKHDNNWIVNGAYNVGQSSIERLLNSIRLIKMNSPLPENAISAISSKIKDDIFVQIFSDNRLLKAYYIGDYISGSGNYYMLNNVNVPYIAHIPSYDFDLRNNFSTDVKKWLSTTLFCLKKNEISELFVKNFETGDEFFLKNANNFFELYASKNSGIVQNAIDDKILFYLTRFENVVFDDFFYNIDNQTIDSLISREPIFEIDITKTNLSKINFKAYYFNYQGVADKNKFLGLIDNNLVVLAKFYDFDLLIKDYKYFLE
ncbi:MAG: hypothetical protein JXR68_07480 [Bacteroidales bacterium]|nr:hypothetical protein [Bacteroidales bacterium]